MRDFLAEARDGYDLVLIDCPPNLHLCSWAALVAADAVVVPLQAEDYGAQGIASVQEAVAAVRSHANPSLHLLGYLITMFDKRLGIHTMYEATLRQLYGADVFTNAFPLAKDYKEAVAARLPISHYKPKSAAAKATAAVAVELLERCAAMRPEPGRPRIGGSPDERREGQAGRPVRRQRDGVDGRRQGRGVHAADVGRDSRGIGQVPGLHPHQVRAADPGRSRRARPQPTPQGIRARVAPPTGRQPRRSAASSSRSGSGGMPPWKVG